MLDAWLGIGLGLVEAGAGWVHDVGRLDARRQWRAWLGFGLGLGLWFGLGFGLG